MTRRSSVRALAREIYCDRARAKNATTPLPIPPPQPKSDVSDFGHLKVPNSGKPEFGWGRERVGDGERAETDLTAQARALYENTAVPVREIARLCGVTERTLYKYARKQGWTPRYHWRPDGPALRGRGWQPSPAFAPVKGAGARFISRAEQDKPFAHELKATDAPGRVRALASCRDAARLAQKAQAEAAEERLWDECGEALAEANRAQRELAAYRSARRREDEPDAPGAAVAERALKLAADIALARWEMLLAQARHSGRA